MKRWLKSMRKVILRSALAIFVCSVVIVPVFLPTIFAAKSSVKGDGRDSTALQSFEQRSADKVGTAPALFNEPLISITFDDGWQSVYSKAMPLLQKYGIHTTQYVLSGTSEDKNYLSWQQIKNMKLAGHEIGCHSVSHADLVTLESVELRNEIINCRDDVQKQVGPITSFASPHGSYNNRTLDIVKPGYSSHRNIKGVMADGITKDDVNTADNFDRYQIIGVTIHNTTTVEDLKKLVAQAEQTNGWLVLTYHQAGDSDSQYAVDPIALESQLKYLSGLKHRIVTVDQVVKTLNVEF